MPEPDIPKDIRIRVYQDKKIRLELMTEFEFEPGKIALLAIPQMPFTIDQDTSIRVVAECEGYKPTELLKKRVSAGAIPPP